MVTSSEKQFRCSRASRHQLCHRCSCGCLKRHTDVHLRNESLRNIPLNSRVFYGMRLVCINLFLLLGISTLQASEIREFDLKTIERLADALTRVSREPARGATTPERKRAKETAAAALHDKLYNIHYDYVVLGDPEAKGFLVYALGRTNNPSDVVLAGHFRVTVSADGRKAERVDALSKSLAIQKRGQGLPPGSHQVGMYLVQIVSSQPLETIIYASNLAQEPIVVATFPDGRIWEIKNGHAKNTGERAGEKKQ